ncbi:MAG: hydrogenase maturation protease [Thermoleophilia bacterium]
MSARALIACVGNDLVADDAAGCAVCDLLEESPLPEGIRLLRVGVMGVALLDELQGEELLVVVDAVQLGGAAGTVHVLEWEALPAAGQAVTGHGIGVREALEVGRLLYPERMPRRVVLVGIEGRCFDGLGEPLTDAVAAAVGPGAAPALELVGAGG